MKPKNAHYCNQIFLPKLWSVTTNILANKQNENDFLAEYFKLALYNRLLAKTTQPNHSHGTKIIKLQLKP